MKIGKIFLILFVVGILVLSGCTKSANLGSTGEQKIDDAQQGTGSSDYQDTGQQELINNQQETEKVKPVIIEVKASQWKFEPSTITVNKGDKVSLKITSQDVTHGFNLPAFNINENLPPGETVTVEFVADKEGEFGFACSVYCGEGHTAMHGKIVVV